MRNSAPGRVPCGPTAQRAGLGQLPLNRLMDEVFAERSRRLYIRGAAPCGTRLYLRRPAYVTDLRSSAPITAQRRSHS
jgi:hypothetical protein